MNENDSKNLQKVVTDSSRFREEFVEFKVQTKFQLNIAQMDFFKSISSIIIALLGIGYVFDQKFADRLDKTFLILSTATAVVLFFLIISYVREAIDNQDSQLNNTEKELNKEMDEAVSKAVEAIEKNNPNYFYEFAERKLKENFPSDKPEYQGEIFVFLLYLSITFLILSFLGPKCGFTLMSCETLLSLFIIILASFKGWSMKFVKCCSEKFEQLKNFNNLL